MALALNNPRRLININKETEKPLFKFDFLSHKKITTLFSSLSKFWDRNFSCLVLIIKSLIWIKASSSLPFFFFLFFFSFFFNNLIETITVSSPSCILILLFTDFSHFFLESRFDISSSLIAQLLENKINDLLVFAVPKWSPISILNVPIVA